MAEINFTGFLLAHKCMRREYGWLAEAIPERRAPVLSSGIWGVFRFL
jgi:hypothetical protein